MSEEGEAGQHAATILSGESSGSHRPGAQRSFSERRSLAGQPPESLQLLKPHPASSSAVQSPASSGLLLSAVGPSNSSPATSAGSTSPARAQQQHLNTNSSPHNSSVGERTARLDADFRTCPPLGQQHHKTSLMTAPPNSMSFTGDSSHESRPAGHSQQNMPTSPCYVHSHLDLAVSSHDRRRSASSSANNNNSSSNNNNNASSSFPAYPHSASPFQTRHSSKRSTAPMHHTAAHNLAFSPSADQDYEAVRTPRMVHRKVPQSSAGSAKEANQAAKDKISERERHQQDGDDNNEAGSDGSITEEGEDDEAATLTRRLAETATSVREMSKQLGRARVKSNINSILIITKARDNHLIKLTRELAIWIMTEIRPSSSKERGVIAYVDQQLQKSKRFDAAGIERDYPHLFRPLVRRFSRHSSVSSHRNSSLPNLRASQNQFASKMAPLSTTENAGMPPSASATNSAAGSTNASAQVSPKDSPPASAVNSDYEYVSSGSKDKDDGQKGQLRYWTADMCQNSPHLFDFVITLGGDGTVLFASWLFQRIVPPIIPFALGSLGFLTNFDFSNYKPVLKNVLDDGVRINLRMRFSCTVYRAVDAAATKRRAVRSGRTGDILTNDLVSGGWDAIECDAEHTSKQEARKDKEVLCFTTKPAEQFEVINDLVVDRGPSPYVSLLELFGDEHHLTTVQADGLCVATPTGSTAYSLSAGGSLVHPESPAILVTPLCPHTLSFRPIILPDSMELRICVPYNSRSTAWASFDGRGRVELRQGDHIKITASPYPFPTVCKDKQSTDWFSSIARTLKWNERQRQKSFVVVEEERGEPGEEHKQADGQKVAGPLSGSIPVDADGNEEDDEEEEEFDIDDLSASETNSNSMPPTPERKPVDQPERPVDQLLSLPSGASLSVGEDDGRFMDPAPRPPPLSRRHTFQDPEDTHQPTQAAGPSHQRGLDFVEGPDLREAVPERSRKHSARAHARNQTPVQQSARIASPVSPDSLSRRRSENARRAFAVFGEDESDASQSDTSEAL